MKNLISKITWHNAAYLIAAIITVSVANTTRQSCVEMERLQPSGALFLSQKSKPPATPCILYGIQSGWKFPKCQLSTDSAKVDAFFKKTLPAHAHPWEILKRDSCFLQKTSKHQVYAEYGTFTVKPNGKKKFTGASNNSYLFYHTYK